MGVWRGWKPAAAAGACALALWPQAFAEGGASVHGKTLLQTHELPASAVAAFTDARSPASAQTWAAEEFAAVPSGNPYTLVIRTRGTAKSDGEVQVRWVPGWQIDAATRVQPAVPGTQDARAGRRVELVSASSPLSFKNETRVAPVVTFASVNNLRMESVTIEVWSGVGKARFVDLVSAGAPLLTGVVMLGLALWWRRR